MPHTTPQSVQRKLALYAEGTTRAIVVGDRNGLIEWANDAWGRLTGYALAESIAKPIGSFVRQIDLDPAIVSFVHGCFESGQVCEAIVPFTTPDGRDLRIELRVEPLFDERGEVSDFIAIASDASDRVELPGRSERPAARDCVSLCELTRRFSDELGLRIGERTRLEIEVAIEAPEVAADADALLALLRLAGARAAAGLGDAWGTLTVGAGLVGCGRGPIFRGDPRRLLPPLCAAQEGPCAYLEIHDTGPELGPLACDADEPFLCDDPVLGPGLKLDEARSRLREMGGELLVQVEPWTGTSVLLLLPVVGSRG